MPDIPSFDEFALDEEEQAIVDLLSRLVGGGPAAFFRDACRLTRQTPALGSLSNLLAHLSREIDSAIEELLVDPTALVAGAEERCEACGAPLTEDKCESCGSSRRATHREKKVSVLQRWGVPDDDPMAVAWLSDEDLAKYAHRRGYGPPRAVDAQLLERFQRAKRVFRWLLTHFEDEFLTKLRPMIDAALEKGPDRGGVKELRSLPFTLVVHQYMFLALESADWIEPLVKGDFYSWPPSVSTDSEGNLVYPPWPQSRYLVQCASQDPAAVCGAVLAIPDTDNPWIIQDIFEVASIVPIALVPQLLPKLCECLSHPISMPWREASPVARRLKEGGFDVEAMRLVLAALMPSPEQSGMAPDERGEAIDLLSPKAPPEELGAEADDLSARLRRQQRMADNSRAFFVSPDSPLSEEAVEAMTIEELADYVVSWRPPGDPFGSPSERGLAESVCRLVDKQPREWARHAHRFASAPPEFAGWFLSAFVSALRNGVDLEWEKLTEYLETIVFHDADDDSHWARQEAATLLDEGLRRTTSGFTADFRFRAWTLIERLAVDSHPSPQDEAEFGLDDPFTYSLNCVRGKAAHTVFTYLAFVHRELGGKPFRIDEDVPEAARELERLLDAAEKSAAVRAAIGTYWPWLYSVDEEWALSHSAAVFPLDDKDSRLRRPAWVACVSWNRPGVEFFQAFRTEYLKAAAELAIFKPSGEVSDYHRRFAEHIGLLLLWCAIDPRENDEVLTTFLQRSPVDTRNAFVDFLGRCLVQAKDLRVGDQDGISEEAMHKLAHLLDQRLASTDESSDELPKELEGFGLWLVSGLFDDEWVLERLVAIANRGGRIERPDLLGGYLAERFADHPVLVLEACVGLLDGSSSTLVFRGRRPEILAILAAAESHDDNAIAAAGHQLRNRLVARGFIAYGLEG